MAKKTKKSAKKSTKHPKLHAHPTGWFVAVRGSYLPNSWQAWLTYFPFVAYLVFALLYGLNHTDSTAQAILFIIPNWVAAAVIMTWVAKRTC